MFTSPNLFLERPLGVNRNVMLVGCILNLHNVFCFCTKIDAKNSSLFDSVVKPGDVYK